MTRVISPIREDVFLRNYAYAKYNENKTPATFSEFTVKKDARLIWIYSIKTNAASTYKSQHTCIYSNRKETSDFHGTVCYAATKVKPKCLSNV